ncbi:MAG: aspartate-semialdehyde dehydrogenase [Gammaproteobacteria bacterium]|jgi:aspartate-semialdehyde dehydrogenase|nr:aspartate-semialdehyde dehydrogenase [Gammaproteobacteria bacterium]
MPLSTVDVAILGASGAVGEALLNILAQRHFPIGQLYLLASHRSAGQEIKFAGKIYRVQDAEHFDFSKVQLAFFSAGSKASEHFVPRAAAAHCLVIDNTSQFRYDDDVPLVISEVNPEAIADYKKRYIIANPNCSTMQLLPVLKPIYDAVGISRINVATYQSVSGAGGRAIGELRHQTTASLNNEPIISTVFPKPIAFNVIPQIDPFQANGYTREEMKMVWETQKILNDPEIKVNVTAVRVPVLYGHSEAVHLETKKKITTAKVRKLLSNAPGIVLMDDPQQGVYPTAVTEAAGRDPVFVGRVREDISHPLGIDLWIVADNIRKGAALNAIQIAEIVLRDYF